MLKGPYRTIQPGVMGRQFRNDQNANLDDIWSDVQESSADIQSLVAALSVAPTSGDANAEVTAARTNADGNIFTSLANRLLDLDSYFSELFFVFIQDLDAGLFTDSETDTPIDGGAW